MSAIFKTGLIVFLVFPRFVHSFPMQSYKNYLFILVHGVGADDRPLPKTYLWTDENDDGHSENVFGNTKGYLTGEDGYAPEDYNNLQPLGFAEHVYNYEFSRPAGRPWSPDSTQATLARELGDRDYYNPASGLTTTFIDKELLGFIGEEKRHKYDWGIEDGNCVIEQAKADWIKWYRSEHNDSLPDENDLPKKIILIAHSMGGLTTRGYIYSSFYQGDVDKLITIDSPHEGSFTTDFIKRSQGIRENAITILGTEAYLALSMSLVNSTNPDPKKRLDWNTYIWTSFAWSCLLVGVNALAPKLFYKGNEPAIDFMSESGDLKLLNTQTNLTDTSYYAPLYRIISTKGAMSMSGKGQGWNTVVPFLPVLAYPDWWIKYDLNEKITSLGLSGLGMNMGHDGDVLVPYYSQQGKKVAAFKENTIRYSQSINMFDEQFAEGKYAEVSRIMVDATNIYLMFKIMDNIPFGIGSAFEKNFYKSVIAISTVSLYNAVDAGGNYWEIHGHAARLAHEKPCAANLFMIHNHPVIG